MRVEKIQPSSKASPASASAAAEQKMFHTVIGSQASYATHKNGLHEAMKDAENMALQNKVKAFKMKMDKKLAIQQKKADEVCAISKAQIAKLNGAAHSAARAAHLARALKFCLDAKM